MRQMLRECKQLACGLCVFLALCTANVPAQTDRAKAAAQRAALSERYEKQLYAVDQHEVGAFGNIPPAYAKLFGQRERDANNKKALAAAQQEIADAERYYRNVLGVWARVHATGRETGEINPGLFANAYEKAFEHYLAEIAIQASILHRDLARADNDIRAEERKGAARGRIRAAHLRLSVVAEIWAAYEPVTEAAFVPPSVRSTALLPNGRFSTLLAHLGWLAAKVGSIDPNNLVIPSEYDADMIRFLVTADRDIALEEFRRLAQTGTLVNPRNKRPVEGSRRIDLAKTLESNFQEYLKLRGSQQSDFDKLIRKADDRLRLAQQIKMEIDSSPEYRIASHLDAGLEPDFKNFFLAAALAVSRTQQDLQEKFNKQYLGEGFWETGLGQLLRANDAVGTGDAGNTAVKARVEQAIADGDAVVRAMRKAAFTKDPKVLKETNPKYFRLLKEFGYVVEFTGRDGKPAVSYRVPGTSRGLGNRLRRDQSAAALPGASVLDVITPKSVSITLASIIVPELGAAWLTSGAGILATSSGGLLAIRAVAEMGVGFYLDTAIEKCEKGNKGKKIPDGAFGASSAFLQNCYNGQVNYEKLVLESVVLGSLLQVTGGKTSEILEWMNWRRQRNLQTDRLYKSMEAALRKEPDQLSKLWEFVGEGVGLAQETAITEAFQMASEGREFDINLLMSTLINNTMSRTLASSKLTLEEAIRQPEVPRIVRDMIQNDPVVKAEVRQNHLDRINRERAVRERYEAVTRDTEQPGRKVFEALLNGDLTWTQLKNLYASDPTAMDVVMTEVAVRREQFFVQIIEQARQRSIEDVESNFARQAEAAVKLAGSREAAKARLEVLEQRRRAELDLVNSEIKTPGSKNPTSDIDRSSSSAFLRKNLIHLYEAHARWLVDGELPTSAKAFDVNEYINVFPFITENAGLVREIKQTSTVDGIPHTEYMEAMSLSGAVQHMLPDQRTGYIQGQRDVINLAIAEGRATDADRAQFDRMAALAGASLQTSRARLDRYAGEIAAREGKNASDPEMQLKAKEYLYDLRMKEIRDLQWELTQLEQSLGDQKHPEAIKKRAAIERKMSLAMRDGIETYSYTVGLDIIVNRVQSAKKTITDADGNPKEVPMEVADRLEDPAFVLKDGGPLDGYTAQDMRAVLNDQVMFIAEHINGFNSGHESTYLAGRGIGKYTERAFLALKIMGLDIAEVRSRPANDPTRRLLEASQKMASLKNDPIAMNEYMATLSRREPASPSNGLAEIFYMIEQVVPGMAGATGVVPPKDRGRAVYQLPVAGNPYARPSRVSALQKEIERLTMITAGAGYQHARDYLESEIGKTEAGIRDLDQAIAALHSKAKEYRLLDWEKIGDLQQQIGFIKIQQSSLLYHTNRSAVMTELGSSLTAKEAALERARETPISGDIQKILYADPSSWQYRHDWNRLDWLRARRAWLAQQRQAILGKAELEAKFAGIKLDGIWACKSPQNEYSLTLQTTAPQASATHTSAQQLTGRLEGAGQTRLATPAQLVFSRDLGRLSGFLVDNARPVESLGAPVAASGTRMMFKGKLDPDGKRFQFTFAPRHPRLSYGLEDVICERGGASGQEEQGFLTAGYGPLPGTPAHEWTFEAGQGFIRARLLSPDGKQAPHEFTLLKGRQRAKTSRGTHIRMPAGAYTAVIKLGGRQSRVPVEIRSGQLTTVEIRAASLTVLSLIEDGAALDAAYKIFSQGGLAGQSALLEAKTPAPLLLSPGSYEVIVGGAFGFPSSFKVDLEAGGKHEEKVLWKALALPELPSISGIVQASLRPMVDGATGQNWKIVGAPFLVRSGKKNIAYVPEGTYAVRLEGGKTLENLKAD